MSVLAQVHLDDLRRSGLTDETIAAAGFYSLTPEQLLEVTKSNVLNRSGLAIPYPGCQFSDGTPYVRVRLTKSFTGSDGKQVRYLTRKGETNQLYLSALLPPDYATNPQVSLGIVEGEKKELAGCQAGIPCIGLAGVWCWKMKVGEDSRPLPDLDAIVWNGRQVSIIFDSDIVTNDRVQKAEEALAKELTSRGAQVTRVRLPGGPNGEKVGLDDYLLNHTKDDFLALPTAESTEAERKPAGRTIWYRTFATTEPGDIPWIVRGILPQQSVNILGGDAGSGKTWLSLDLAHAVASGRPWLGRFEVTRGPVLCYDEESAQILLHHRIWQLRKSEPDLPADLDIRYRLDTSLQIDVPESVAMIETDLAEQVAALIVIDSFRACFAGDENRSAEVRVALQNLRRIAHEWGCAILVLHHTRKISQTSNSASQMLRGSTDLRGAVDNHLFIRAREPGNLILEHEKSRWAPPVETFGVQFVADDEKGMSLHYIADPDPQAEKLDEAKLAIISEVQGTDQAVDRPALLARAQSLGVSRRTAERAVGELEESRQIIRVGKQGRRVLYERNRNANLPLP